MSPQGYLNSDGDYYLNRTTKQELGGHVFKQVPCV